MPLPTNIALMGIAASPSSSLRKRPRGARDERTGYARSAIRLHVSRTTAPVAGTGCRAHPQADIDRQERAIAAWYSDRGDIASPVISELIDGIWPRTAGSWPQQKEVIVMVRL
jgi:hypothetical protein